MLKRASESRTPEIFSRAWRLFGPGGRTALLLATPVVCCTTSNRTRGSVSGERPRAHRPAGQHRVHHWDPRAGIGFGNVPDRSSSVCGFGGREQCLPVSKTKSKSSAAPLGFGGWRGGRPRPFKNRRALGYLPDRILWGSDGRQSNRLHGEEAEVVVSALVGAAGLRPTLAACSRAGRTVALANKGNPGHGRRSGHGGSPPTGGSRFCRWTVNTARFFRRFRAAAAGIRQADHFDVLSGGPLPGPSAGAKWTQITRRGALRHPNWKMGPKVSIDSATLMNKGLESHGGPMVVRWIPLEQVAITIHPQSIIHSLVEYRDGSILAQMGLPDMRGADRLRLQPVPIACP